jgi:endonuclease/exonuclease/phosphatase family metal-dependent hydrolase
MTIRVATFNVENLFERPKAMNQKEWAAGQGYINDCTRLDTLFGQDAYSDADKEEILTLLEKYTLDQLFGKNDFLTLREVRGKLLAHPKGKRAEVVASGRGSWVGWVELNKEPIVDEAVTNTARVIADVNADIIVMVEIESRRTLINFHDSVLNPLMKEQNQEPYPHIMSIIGNDPRGINVGIMSRHPILEMVSHVDDETPDHSPMFSRDCPEYYIGLEDGQELVILPNHLTSQGSDKTGRRRRVQATAVKAIYKKIRNTHNQVIVAGDLNQDPANGALDPVLKETDLTDAMALPVYTGKYPGTYQTATARNKFDYLLLSPDLAGKVTAVDVNRKGYYAPKEWESYENINKVTKHRYDASDHQCLWADIDL